MIKHWKGIEGRTRITGGLLAWLNSRGRATLGAALVATLALSAPAAANPKERPDPRACSDATLEGEYGLLASGIRFPPGVPEGEFFIGAGMRTYDGEGGFTDTPHGINGSITGFNPGAVATGTYQVNADCTGTATRIVEGLPIQVVTQFVIVDGGNQVKEAVMAPARNVVTVILDRK